MSKVIKHHSSLLGLMKSLLFSWCLAASEKSINMNQKLVLMTFKTTNILSKCVTIFTILQFNHAKVWLIFYCRGPPSFIRTADP
jgi:hypothetical protein